MSKHRRFKDFIEGNQLDESSLLSKGYSLVQKAKFDSNKRNIQPAASKADALLSKSRFEEDIGKKIDYVMEAVTHLADAQKFEAEALQNLMYSLVAINLLEDDIRNLLIRRK